MRTIALLLEYDGARYAGWQAQRNATGVQEVVEGALKKLLGHEVRIHAAGRTDRGVHAEGQVCSFRTARNLPLRAFVAGLNGLLPADVRSLEARQMPTSFHARRSALCKCYQYQVVNRPQGSALLRERAWQIFAPLDWAAMRRAARAFEGSHDFAAFRAAGARTKTTRRRIEELGLARQGPVATFRFVGDGFLRGQVRSMVGTLVAVGRGKLPEEAPARLLRRPDRQGVGPTAPGCGLTLLWVDYGEGPWRAPGGGLGPAGCP